MLSVLRMLLEKPTKKIKDKKCKICWKVFIPSSSLQNTCSQACADKKKENKKSRDKLSFAKVVRVDPSNMISWSAARQIYIENFLIEHGSIYCLRCDATNPGIFGWEVHQIIYRSQLRGHKDIHHPRNLMMVCGDCHKKMHKSKSAREEWIRRRRLWEIYEVAEKYKD